MNDIVFIGSHLGYPMDTTPLGGGAMVGLHLARRWSQQANVRLRVLGSGPVPPAAGLDFVRLPEGGAGAKGLVSLSELEYARFCRRFEEATTSWVLDRPARLDPRRTCIVVNDISEGPTLARLTRAGFPIVSLWHVDVVDYFNRLYLKEFVRPERLTRLYEAGRGLGAARLLPDLLKLVFEKQRQTVVHSKRMVFPSNAMAQTIRRCYAPADFARRGLVVPWGVWERGGDARAAEALAARLKGHYQLGDRTAVLMTLSRISPEKGLHLLLEALRRLERSPRRPEDLCLFICGEPAFMRGESYLRQVRQTAARLKSARVFFPGYLADAEKQAYYRLAHLFVSPSIHDSYGLNIVEAMQAGLPILASDHYGVQDILSEEFGRKVHYGKLSAAPGLLAAELGDLLSDRGRLSRMGERARAAAEAMPFERAADAVLAAATGLLEESSVGSQRP
ncbi:MAG: glycosyltransferase family 4 protein [Elusimicrobia bacterium]|nr:glycosyltransferase family 4 protein [Elusimicrobiota bacterium]